MSDQSCAKGDPHEGLGVSLHPPTIKFRDRSRLFDRSSTDRKFAPVRRLVHLAGAFLAALSAAHSQTPQADWFNPWANDSVHALALQTDGELLTGGYFTTMGEIPRGRISRLGTGGSVDAEFDSSANDFVYSLGIQRDGKILVGGSFTSLCGEARSGIGRVHANGTLDVAFDANVGGDFPMVYAIAEQADGKILIGGEFTMVAGQARGQIARLNANDTLDDQFDPGVGSTVCSIVVQFDGKILVGGIFTNLAGQIRNGLGRLHPDGSLDEEFNPDFGHSDESEFAGEYPSVHAVAVQRDGRILVAGIFTTVGGQARTNIARLNPDGSVDAGFAAGTDGGFLRVYSLILQADGKILIGGGFSSVNGVARHRIARLNPDGTLDSGFDSSVGGSETVGYFVNGLALQSDGGILVSGYFTTLAGQSRNHIGRLFNTEPATQSLALDGSTVTWIRAGTSPEFGRTSFEYSTNGVTWAFLGIGAPTTEGWRLTNLSLPPGSTLRARGQVTGGYFNASSWFEESFAGAPMLTSQPTTRTNSAGSYAAFGVSAEGSAPLGYQWRKNGVALSDGGNYFGATTAWLAVMNVLKGDEGAYDVVVSNVAGITISKAATLTVIDPVIVTPPLNTAGELGGNAQFNVTAAGTPPLQYRWWKDGVALTQYTAKTLQLTNLHSDDAGMYSVEVHNTFGIVTSAVAALLINMVTLDPVFDPNANQAVYAMAVQHDGRIIVGGHFTSVGGQPRKGIARLNSDGTLDREFAAAVEGSFRVVDSLAIQPGGKILVGGAFSTVNGYGRGSLARLHADGTLDLEFSPRLSGLFPEVNALMMQADGKLIVAGKFDSIDGQIRKCLGRLNADGTLDSAFNPMIDGSFPYVSTLAIQTDGKILMDGTYTSVGGQPRENLVRLNSDGSLDEAFNPEADDHVKSIVVQPDGRILVGGRFWTLGGQLRKGLGRLNADGTLDESFNPAIYDNAWLVALQADGSILAGGGRINLGNQPRYGIARFNADGTLDPRFNPNIQNTDDVLSMAVQADGGILVGGVFSMAGGQPRNGIARFNNTMLATNRLTHDGSTLTWLRGGSSPEAWRTTFAATTNGFTWTSLGEGTRIPGGWQLTNVPCSSNATIRACGFVSSGQNNSSTWFVESLLRVGPPAPILLNVVREGFGLVLNWTGGLGPYQVQQAANLGASDSWANFGSPVQTNSASVPLGQSNLFLRVQGR